jgi:hypothetical protein
MTTEVVTTETKEVTLPAGSLGVADEIGHEDCERGFITVMQTGSELVKEDRARAGAILNFNEEEEVGYKEETPFEFLLVGMHNFWIEKDGKGTDAKYLGKYPGTSEKELPWEDVNEKGETVCRFFHRAYVVLIPGEVAQGIEIPYEYATRSTALKSAKKFNALLRKLRGKGVASWDKVFKMTTYLHKDGKNSWYLPKFEIARDATEAEREAAKAAYLEFAKVKDGFLKDETVVGNDVNSNSQY